MPYWSKNALFLGLCLVGLAWLGSSILRRDRIRPPRDFSPWNFTEDRLEGKINDLKGTRDKVNAEFREHWSKANLDHAAQADSLAIVRRLSLGLTGTVPSLEEIRQLEKVPSDDRVQWW